tara:strand:+ start:396 stop:950 length:555 start_codon:yes stop_codon:yes gene_type:complete
MVDEIYNDSLNKMKKALEFLLGELSTIRTGRATTNLVENVKVDYYGTLSPLKNISHISAPEAQLIVIQPFDPMSLEAIEKSILSSDLGLNPNNDGTVIRLSIPALTEERRNEIIKIAHKVAEEGRISVRNVRRYANEQLKNLEKDHDISEDNLKRALDNIQELTDEYIKKIDTALANKEEDIKL